MSLWFSYRLEHNEWINLKTTHLTKSNTRSCTMFCNVQCPSLNWKPSYIKPIGKYHLRPMSCLWFWADLWLLTDKSIARETRVAVASENIEDPGWTVQLRLKFVLSQSSHNQSAKLVKCAVEFWWFLVPLGSRLSEKLRIQSARDWRLVRTDKCFLGLKVFRSYFVKDGLK